MFAVKTENLTKYYGAARGIIDVSLTVEEGSILGFIGPNGAGKSTTIRTLLGLISPSSGSASVLGMDIIKDRVKILRSVGYLSPETAFYSGATVDEIVRFSAKLRNADCSDEAKRLFERLELDPKRRINELSFGNKKKVGIVCAMQHKPALYVFDEPTSGLDPLMQQQFFELLSERSSEGASVLLSSHVLSEVSKHCTHAAIIRDGRLLAEKRMDEVAKTDYMRVSLTGLRSELDIKNAANIKKSDHALSFVYSGSAKELISELSRLDFDGISISEPDLDEVFMSYYTQEEKRNDDILS